MSEAEMGRALRYLIGTTWRAMHASRRWATCDGEQAAWWQARATQEEQPLRWLLFVGFEARQARRDER